MSVSSSSSSSSSSGPNLTGMQTLSEMTGGINYSQIITELYDAEDAPAQALDQNIQNDQLYINDWSNISNLATTVQNDLVTLADASTYQSFNTATTGAVASATAQSGASPGTYDVSVQTVGSNATMTSSSADGAQGVGGEIGQSVSTSTTLNTNAFSQSITNGTISFTYNGQDYSYTVNNTNTLGSTLAGLNQLTGDAVDFSYSSSTNKITVTNNGSGEVILGSPGDSSNFFQAAGLNGNTANAGGTTNSNLVGVAQLQQTLISSNLAGTLTPETNGAFKINGVTINYDTSSDSLQSIMQSINSSTAGVTATYDPISDKITLTSNSAQPITVSDTTGNLASILGLSGTSGAGTNWVYTVGNDSNLSSPSATVQGVIPGVSFTLASATTSKSGTLKVSQNTDTLTKAVNQFIGDFNNLYSQIQTYTGKNGDLESDTNLNNLGMQMMNDVLSVITKAQTDGYAQDTAMGIGITTGPIGSAPGTTNSLQLNASTLVQQFNTNPSEVQTILQGIASTLNNDLTVYTGSFNTLTPTSVIASFGTSVVQAQTNMYNNDITNLEQEQTNIENTASSYEQNLTNEFTALQQYQEQMSMVEEEMSSLSSSSSSA